MVKKRLMLGAAFAALSLVPLQTTPAAAEDLLDKYDLDIKADWDNDVEIDLDWSVDVDKELYIRGSIYIDGSVTAEALSQATLDDKQFLSENQVQFEDYQNANTSGEPDSEPGVGTNESSPDFQEEGAPHPATYNNSVSLTGSAISANGNIGINMAAGDYNLQENAAVLSNADGFFPDETQTYTSTFAAAGADAGGGAFEASGAFEFTSTSANSAGTNTTTINVYDPPGITTTTSTTYNTTSADADAAAADGSISLAYTYNNSFTDTASYSEASGRSARSAGAAEAGSFSLQSLYNNEFNTGTWDYSELPFSLTDGTDEQNPEIENTVVNNSVTVEDGTLNAAEGNIGLNMAAGAFNIQKNALVIASVDGGHLAEATSGVLQHAEKNHSVVEDVTNTVSLDAALTATSGNIGVNLAAGVGNLQLNTLTIANALPGDPVVSPPPGPPPAPPGDGGGETP